MSNYIIHRDGRVWSKKTNKFLKPAINHQGYYQLLLDGKCKRVNRLVAQTYIPNPENKPEVNHKDGNKLNNVVSNLEWCTSSENSKHSVENGLQVSLKGEERWNHKLTEEDVNNIKFLNKTLAQKQVAEMYGVDASLISRIVNNKLWKHVS